MTHAQTQAGNVVAADFWTRLRLHEMRTKKSQAANRSILLSFAGKDTQRRAKQNDRKESKVLEMPEKHILDNDKRKADGQGDWSRGYLISTSWSWRSQ